MTTNRQIFAIAWPYALSMATGFIVQAVNSAMVAPMGSEALATLTVAATTCSLPLAFTMGLVTSVQKRVATAKSRDEVNRALSTNLLLAILMMLPFMLLYQVFASELASLFTSGKAVELTAYFIRITVPSFAISALNQAINGYWVGQLKSKTRLLVVSAVTLATVTGNMLLIPQAGIFGVAISSLVALTFGFLLNIYLTVAQERFKFVMPTLRELGQDIGVVFGVCFHQVSLVLSMNAVVFIVGKIGVQAQAVANVVGMLSLPALYLGIGYGTAIGSFLVRALMDGDMAEARSVANKALLQVLGTTFFLSLVLLVGSSCLRAWFFRDPQAYEMARVPLLLLSVLFLVDGVCCTLQRFHFVADRIKESAFAMTIVQWVLFLPLAWYGVQYLQFSYNEFFALHVLQRVLVSLWLFVMWRRRIQVSPLKSAGVTSVFESSVVSEVVK